MPHYAFVVPPYTGHLNPTTVLARALQRRGHRITFFSSPDARDAVERAGLDFRAMAGEEIPAGRWRQLSAASGQLAGLRATVAAARIIALLTRGMLRELPGILAAERFDGLVMDQICVGAESICAVAGMPLAVSCSALGLHIESGVPPPYFAWRYRRSAWARARNTVAQFAVNLCGWSVLQVLAPYRSRHRLPAMRFHFINDLSPSLVQVMQQPAFFDFPRQRLPDHAHYTGPWIERAARVAPPFPWERLDGRPLVFASFGTVQKQMARVLDTVLAACAGLGVQVVVALGRSPREGETRAGGDVVMVEFAPQLELLRRAALVITHAGLNTTLETIAAGVPMVALPISNDQGGNAVRIEHLGLGLFMPFGAVTLRRLRNAVTSVLRTPAFAERARARAVEIGGLDGAATAAALLERAFTTRERIRRDG